MSATASPMPISLLEWKPLSRNSLRGFATVRLGQSLKISDIAVHAANGRRWAQLPARPALNTDGTARRDENGKIQYIPLMKWLDRDASDRFSEGVIAAIEREYPGTVDA